MIPYYQRFMCEFPTPYHLSEASLDRVLKVWEGLGYYARVRNLKRAAEEVVESHGGTLPSNFDDIHKLPGVGRSTAGAILSIGYGQRKPILEANVRRVLCRVFGIRTDLKAKQTEKQLWFISEILVPKRNPAVFNQAIMDFGALICIPKKPSCSVCPIAKICVAHRLGIQEEVPKKQKKRPVPLFKHVAGLIQFGDSFMLHQRPQKGLLGGLWEFPGGRLEEGENPMKGVARILFDALKVPVKPFRLIGNVRHTFSHFKMNLLVYQCTLHKRPRDLPEGYRWVFQEEIRGLALPSAQQKVLSLIENIQ